MLTRATFQLNELYHSGNPHVSIQPDDVAELTQVISDAVAAGGIDVYVLVLTALAIHGNVVEWEVAVTLPTAQIDALHARHAAPAFVASIESDAYLLGDTHLHSLYETMGFVDASATPFVGAAPSPPPLR